ncbi:sporulation integral membrane protein YtvI [Paenibacillus sp. MZ04-78.2]|uniref:sporulation integral membrane protein YtvI n=1 Tax=Paenibacillus sp. MZ04-78.2 TaxID=2962034 RepID=UPI0020B693A2|nr:sporulation integral membrane protein YtvI [Paenibacillus sp. MZ04-78.2]MCP3772254.1 sporulation integral membrane protein YtvI [Paenibacillus sp. MZ04-78.2]
MSLRTIVFCVLGAVLLYGLFTIGFPFLLAMLIALLLEPIVLLLTRMFRGRRVTVSAVVCTLFTGSLLGFVYLIGFKIVTELIQFWNYASVYLSDAKLLIEDSSARNKLFYKLLPYDVAEQVERYVEAGAGMLTENLKSIIAAVSGYFLDVAKAIPNLLVFSVVFVIGLYLISFGLPKLHQSFLNLFESQSRPKVAAVLNDLRRALLSFLFAQVLISLLTYVVTLVGLLVLKVNYPLAVALLIVLVDILPVLGTSVVLVPWAGYSMLAGDMRLGTGLIILLLVIMLFRRLIEPKIIGDAVGINALAALVSMYVGFQLAGVIGLILGPVLIIVYQALRRVGLLKINIKLEQ